MVGLDKENVLHLLGSKIPPGKSVTINFNLARLYTTSTVEIPVIVVRSKNPGPIVLLTSGIHGDELNGVEIVRQIIAKKINKPIKGTIICMPVLNIFGFLEMKRYFPDGRDLNRVFPGSAKGSLASRIAYQFTKKILPVADLCMDFHTGGASRFNAAQVRIAKDDTASAHYASLFNPPFILETKVIPKSYRATCARLGIPILLFEGGKSQVSDKEIAKIGVIGVMNVLQHLGMLTRRVAIPETSIQSVYLNRTKWIRAKYSGLLHLKISAGDFVPKGTHIATITDPYGKFRHKVTAPHSCYLINTNEASLVYQGDAIFNISLEETVDEQK